MIIHSIHIFGLLFSIELVKHTGGHSLSLFSFEILKKLVSQFIFRTKHNKNTLTVSPIDSYISLVLIYSYVCSSACL